MFSLLFFLAVRFGCTVTLKTYETNLRAQGGIRLPKISRKALDTLQNKPILAAKPTPFLHGQIEGDSHSHEMQSARGHQCVRTKLGPETPIL